MKSTDNPIRIGTRDSQLALWQAYHAQRLIEDSGYRTEIVPIKSEGDLDLVTPLYAMGVQGVFTRALDAALLSDYIDVAVHSMKDVPIQLAEGVVYAAVTGRADNRDFLVTRESGIRSFGDIPNSTDWVVATSSIRRRAQWLHKFSNHRMVDLRGNITTRLQKLHESAWDAAIFAGAALERLGIDDENYLPINWMVSAPAQGAILMVCRAEDTSIRNLCAPLQDEHTAAEVFAERSFLNELMGGCATPIAASAKIIDNKMFFKGNVCSPDGHQKIEIMEQFSRTDFGNAGQLAAAKAISQGAKELLVTHG